MTVSEAIRILDPSTTREALFGTEKEEGIRIVTEACVVAVKALEEVLEYRNLEEQGLLLRLPCKCNEVVWVAEKGFSPHKALYSCPSAMLDDVEHGIGIGYTKEAAEAALKEMECEL